MSTANGSLAVRHTESPAALAAPGAARGLAMFQGNLLDQLWGLAERFAKASAVPAALRGKVSDIFLVLMNGYELGLSPASALRGIHIVEGKPVLDAALMRGLFLGASPENAIDVIEATPAKCKIKFRRGRREHTHEWSIEQAKAAGLMGKNNWKNYPAEMLVARCSAAGLRIIAADLFSGVYTEDELENATPLNEAPKRGIKPPPAGPPTTVDAKALPAGALPETIKPAREPAEVVPAAPVDTKTQDMFAAGEPPHNPKTGEILDAVADPVGYTVANVREALDAAFENRDVAALRAQRDRIAALPDGAEKDELKARYNRVRAALSEGGAK